MNMSTPPAMRRAGSEMPNSSNIAFPSRQKNRIMQKAVTTDRSAMRVLACVVLAARQTDEHGRVRDRIHDREEREKDRDRVPDEGVHEFRPEAAERPL